MKDYSKFIQSSYGFITHYEIVGDEIHIYTAETEKDEPQKMVATKENIAAVEARLENQYVMLLKNKDVIKEEGLKKVRELLLKVFGVGLSVVLVATVVLWIMQSALPAIFLAILAITGGAACSALTIAKMDKNFENQMHSIREYLEERQNIEERSKSDENITSYLSKKAKNKINTNNKLKKNGIIPNAFNIDFMDKADLEDLKKLLTRYSISVELEEKQYFVAPDEDKSTKLTKKKIKK